SHSWPPRAHRLSCLGARVEIPAPTVNGMTTRAAARETMLDVVSREHRFAALGARGDIEEDELVGPGGVVLTGHLHWVARIGQIFEIHPGVDRRLARLVEVDIDARDDALRERHATRERATKRKNHPVVSVVRDH